MRVAVLGLSDFGYPLAIKLHEIGNEVIAVDRNQELVQRIKDSVTTALVADVTDRAALEELGVDELDAVLISIGRRLEATVMVTHYLREAGVPRIVVKVTDEDQAKVLALVGATDIVQPDHDIAGKTAALLTFPRLIDYAFLTGQWRIAVVKARTRWVGLTVNEFERVRRAPIMLIALDPAEGKTPPLAPPPNHRIQENDSLALLGTVQDLLQELRE